MKRTTIGDTAIDGLLAGIGAGLVMVLLLLAAGVLNGDSPADVIGRFDPARSNNLITGLFTHFAVSATYGAIFGLLFLAPVRLRPALARFGWLTGLLYGLAVYAVAHSAIWAGMDSGLAHIPAVILLLAHAVYGFVIGLLVGRRWQ
jgi:hypothetical protein